MSQKKFSLYGFDVYQNKNGDLLLIKGDEMESIKLNSMAGELILAMFIIIENYQRLLT